MRFISSESLLELITEKKLSNVGKEEALYLNFCELIRFIQKLKSKNISDIEQCQILSYILRIKNLECDFRDEMWRAIIITEDSMSKTSMLDAISFELNQSYPVRYR